MMESTRFHEGALRKAYETAKSFYSGFDFKDLDCIFEIALANRGMFSKINISDSAASEWLYMHRWVKHYYEAKTNPPSKHIAKQKSACSDPAAKVLVKTAKNLSEANASFYENCHNLFMAAENVQGGLLEEYIAERIRPYGFLWCAGSILRATDFCNTNGSSFLQVKNKNNTENSSSNKIREGTDIAIWYRLGTRTLNKNKVPHFKWQALNDHINARKTEGFDLPPCNLSEEEYQRFLIEKVSENTRLLQS